MNTRKNYRKRIREYSEYGIIYKATLILDDRVYIGQTIRSLKERISEHVNQDRFYFNNSIKKYGLKNFKWEIIYKADSQADLDNKEEYYIAFYKSNIKGLGFNLTSGGEHGVYSDEVRNKISKNMLGSNNHRYGKKVSKEIRIKMSKAHTGLHEGIKNNLYGKPSVNRKRIRCIDTGEIFDCITLAANNKNINRTNISNCINGRSNTAGGYIWEVV